MKIAFITTVLNEEENINLLLNSLISQTKLPDEVIIVDGGSKDRTVRLIKEWISSLKTSQKKAEFKKIIKLIVKKGNRSSGRNEAIRRARSEIIVCSDSGCILDKNWIKNIVKPFHNYKVDVVAGYYKGKTSSIFEKSLVPYILVMPDRIKTDKFLPSSRSMSFKKEIWEKVGGFPLQFSNNEDFVFANKLKKNGAKLVFKRDAIVYYLPRKNLLQAFIMFFRYAKGDSESGMLRSKVVLIFIRYILALWFLIYAYYFKLFFIVEVIFYILLLYILWAILKNYKYVKNSRGLIFLPLIQFASDIAVILGTTFGFFKGLWGIQEKR